MPVFRLLTSVKFQDGDIKRFKNIAIPQIANIIKKNTELVTLDIVDNMTERDKEFPDHATVCVVTYFEDQLEGVEEILYQAYLKLQSLVENLVCHANHEFFIVYLSHKNQVLIDWRERSEVIASIPIDDQGPRQNCWAYVDAYIVGSTYSIEHPSVKDLGIIRCSPQDLSDWVYSFQRYKDLSIGIDDYGTYKGDGRDALSYVKQSGVSLLENYKIAKLEKRCIETTFDEARFNKMLASKGERIFIDKYEVLYPDTFLDNNPVFSIELVTQILHQGMAHGTVKCCLKGCKDCTGLCMFNGEGVYDEPPHPKDYEFQLHAVAVIGAGNLDGTDYIRIRNTWGTTWAKEGGHGDLHIKFFTRLIQVSGTKKKTGTKCG